MISKEIPPLQTTVTAGGQKTAGEGCPETRKRTLLFRAKSL
ncbi:hypothetical protein [Kamptonema formosum]|nr:hypothetical protein [Oscillatoria sp. PCC 10802]